MDSVEADEEVCASCGIAAGDNIKLKLCTGCKLVKYCSVDCQKNHRKQHKKECKKRVAEIRDDKLFRQPDESHLGECPICCLHLPLGEKKWAINSCCCQRICKGCEYANALREEEQGLDPRCPYCREPLPDTDEDIDKNYMKRVKANDSAALFQMGNICDAKGDYEGAIPYWTKAAKLGDMDAHFNLAITYGEGHGIEKDLKKKVYHLEEAAIGGHQVARYNLGCIEGNSGRMDRAMKHFIIAAKLGYDGALNEVQDGFRSGLVSKEDFEAALRGHQAAVDATKSEQREEAYAFVKRTGL